MDRRRQTGAEPAVILGAAPRLRRPILFLAALSLLCSVAVGYLAYIANRTTILDDLYQSRLRLARTLAAHYDNEMTFDRDTAPAALDDLQRLWNTTERRFAGSWLTVVRADGWQALNTRRRKPVYAANVILETESDTSPPTVQALLETHQDWVGQTVAPDGSRRLSAYAYSEAQGGLVAVHIPLEEVEARIQALTLPWAVGLGALTLALLLMAGALLEWQHRNATQALEESQRVLATLMSNLPGMVYRCRNDPQWTMEFVSDGVADLTGYQPTDLIGNRKVAYADLIHPDDRQMAWDQVQ
jgi:PAS domain-containing protein